MGDREVVQDRVGGSARCHDQGYGIFNGLAGDDVERFAVVDNRIDQNPRRLNGAGDLVVIRVGLGRGSQQTHAKRLKA